MALSESDVVLMVALKQILKSATKLNGIARGLNEVARSLDKRQAHFCLYAVNCDEPSYEKLVRALCVSHDIPIVELEDKALLGEMVGQCSYDKEGKARKTVGCSCAVITNYGHDDPALAEAKLALEEHLQQKNDVML